MTSDCLPHQVPHLAFGTELTQNASYHERSSLYAWRQAFAYLGSLLGVGALFVLMAREPTGPSAVRQAAFWISLSTYRMSSDCL
jgi:Na+/melibiose symporter-like transporter